MEDERTVYHYEEGKERRMPFTIFGEPIIKTHCQRNAMISAISGGMVGGLIAFLFTSNPRRSTQIGVITYGVIGITGALYCTYDEIQSRSERREFRKLMYMETHKSQIKDTNSVDNVSNPKLESI
ncbi:cytochrome c oxidase assembly factor COX20 lethal (3) 87Df [Bombus fervidus]|uniref:cytochrome c oxidase assembly factor COX20 lethal (3) 87Df n=1 Tax=Bombus fervidus TaxID=203811 RepID=UPI003D18D752